MTETKAKRYRVTAPCITHIPSTSYAGTGLTRSGVALITLYHGDFLPEGVPADKIRHLLDLGMIAEFEG